MKEEWREIKNYEGLYQVSNTGKVKSLDKYVRSKNNSIALKKSRILKLSVNKRGYQKVGLWKNGVKWYLVHRLVAEAFIPNPNNLPQVNHKNEIKTDNRVENLEYCDQKYNVNYGTRLERIAEKMKGKKLSEESKNKISEANSKPVFQYDLNGNFIKEWPSTMEVERRLGIRVSNISKCCNGGYFCKVRNKWVNISQAYGFKWEFKKEDS